MGFYDDRGKCLDVDECASGLAPCQDRFLALMGSQIDASKFEVHVLKPRISLNPCQSRDLEQNAKIQLDHMNALVLRAMKKGVFLGLERV